MSLSDWVEVAAPLAVLRGMVEIERKFVMPVKTGV